MSRIVFDVETNGFLRELDTIYCVGLRDLDADDDVQVYAWGDVEDAVRLLMDADELIGHNIIAFDIPAIQKVFPWFKPRGKITDTFVSARLIWANAKERDDARGKLPGKYRGKQSLAAWGYRLNLLKSEFDPKDYKLPGGEVCSWATIGDHPTGFLDLLDYCGQDGRVTVRLHELIEQRCGEHDWTEALELEHQVEHIIARQMRHGWLFDFAAAEKLTARLQIRHLELQEQLREAFKPFYVPGKKKTPKRDNSRYHYTQDAPLTAVKLVEFNPDSRQHIANRLIKLYDWNPEKFTNGGQPQVDETTLETLAHIPEAALLIDYLTVSKRLGQIATGKQAWLSNVQPDGRIYGAVNANGAVTGRMTHFAPNIAQVPKVGSPYGEECRALFIVPPGKKLVGCDAEGIELRNLGHYQCPFDDGEFGRAVVDGKKSDETDAHSITKNAIDFNSRDNAKTFRYALMYGAGDFKLGLITLADFDEEKKARFYAKFPAGKKRDAAIVRLGRSRRAKLMKGVRGFAQLVDRIKKLAKKRGWLKGLDGRRIYVRSQHAALNTLLQSAGALVMKKALVLMDTVFAERFPGRYEFVGNIHDEVQIEADKEIADEIGRIAAESIRLAGEYFRFRVPLAGDFAVGDNWAETH